MDTSSLTLTIVEVRTVPPKHAPLLSVVSVVEMPFPSPLHVCSDGVKTNNVTTNIATTNKVTNFVQKKCRGGTHGRMLISMLLSLWATNMNFSKFRNRMFFNNLSRVFVIISQILGSDMWSLGVASRYNLTAILASVDNIFSREIGNAYRRSASTKEEN